MTAVYTPSAYDNLPMFDVAGKKFDTLDGSKLVEQFNTLFLEHEMDRVFGLVLNHRHFDLNPDERLVEYRGTSVPWNAMLEKTRPSTWVLSEDGVCFPYEFNYTSESQASEEMHSPDDPKYSAFLKAFNKILIDNDAAGVFGLCEYPGDDFQGRTEITSGRANINLLPQDHRSL